MNHVPPTDRRTRLFALANSKRGARMQRMEVNPVGLKRWLIPGSEFESFGILTPYANKEKRRRRLTDRISKMARKRNR